MKKLFSIILVVALTLTLFTSCAEPAEALTTIYLNLGEKYLTDLNYEEAIVYFNKVIEVEPKNARAYLGSAEAYVAMGDIDSAIAILEQGIAVVDDPTELQAMLAELLGENEAEEELPEDEVIQEEQVEEEIPEITAEDIGAAINEASVFAWGWFWDNLHTDEDDIILATYTHSNYTENDYPFERVTEEGITTLDDLRALAQHYFTADVIEGMIGMKNWIEQDNALYVSVPDGLGGPGDPDYYEIYVQKTSDTSYDVTMYYSYGDDEIYKNEFTCSYVNGYWVFDTSLSCPNEIPVYVLTEPINADPLYEGDELTISGTLVDRDYMINSDNYGTVYILVLDEPFICSLYGGMMNYDGELMKIEEIQLLLPYTDDYIRNNLLGEHLDVTGSVVYEHTGHHLTTVLLEFE